MDEREERYGPNWWRNADRVIMPLEAEPLSDWLRGLVLAHLERGPDETFAQRLRLAEWRTAAALWDQVHAMTQGVAAAVRDVANGMKRPADGPDNRIERAVAKLRKRE